MQPALIDNLGGIELLIVLVVALLVFGKRLPEVAGQAGKQMVKIRRSLDSAWRDTGMEREIREVKRDLESAIPRDLSIGEMARLASAEMDKRIQANEQAARTQTPRLEAPKPPAVEPQAVEPQAVPVEKKDGDGPTTTMIDIF